MKISVNRIAIAVTPLYAAANPTRQNKFFKKLLLGSARIEKILLLWYRPIVHPNRYIKYLNIKRATSINCPLWIEQTILLWLLEWWWILYLNLIHWPLSLFSPNFTSSRKCSWYWGNKEYYHDNQYNDSIFHFFYLREKW